MRHDEPFVGFPRNSYLSKKNPVPAASTYDFYLSLGYRRVLPLVLGVFIFLFLLVFLPFGVDNYNPNHRYTGYFLWEMAKFMLLTTAVAWVLEVWIKPRLLKRVRWQEVAAWSALLLVAIGFCDFLLYNWLGNWHDFKLVSALAFMVHTAAMLIFPLVGTFFYFRYQALHQRFRQMHLHWEATPDRLIHFQGQGSSDQVSIAASDFRYAQAQDNYVALFYLRAGILKKELIRSTLAELLQQAGDPDLVRCHRSFVVNLKQVRSFSGGNPLELRLDGVEAPLRVSRSYRTAILERLRTAASRG